MSLHVATANDYYRFYGKPKPAVFSGVVVENYHMILGIGGVYLSQNLGLCATIDKARGITGHNKWMHRAAMIIMRSLEGQNDPINALADENIAGSGAYLERLGFRRTDEIYNGQNVYKWQQ